ncbi:hypothetical protein ACOJUR_15810 [Alicyclobacillus tolerans]|uniref:hypothetical protein n=1 Tax=Alicyclobacillus tolerans TaxID=90970 RepID=UPI003B79E15F
MSVRLDLNNEVFQEHWLSLEKQQQLDVLRTLKKIRQMTRQQIYSDQGLRWEKILSKKGPGGRDIFTIRVTKEHRAIVYRREEWMIFLSLHPNHDSAYTR